MYHGAVSTAEKEFAGKKRSAIWTYMFLAVVLVLGAVIVNFAIVNPEAAKTGINTLFGLPAWAGATIVFVLGVFIYWIGLKVETDWPEFLGAFMIAGAITAFEFIIGWKRLELGLVVIPYLIPLVVFVVLIMYALKKSE
jgi:hypothetical protein